MKGTIRKMGLGLLVGATVVLGGGFASADYNDGNEGPTTASFDVTYNVLSYRTLELSSTSDVEFGPVRQNDVYDKSGPVLLYGTTWGTDEISVYLDTPMVNGVALSVDAGDATEPGDLNVPCDNPGTSATGVDLSLTDSAPTVDAQPLITGIDNCGAPGYTNNENHTGVDPDSDQWATASTTFHLDTTGAVDTDLTYNLYDPMRVTVNFLIDVAS